MMDRGLPFSAFLSDLYLYVVLVCLSTLSAVANNKEEEYKQQDLLPLLETESKILTTIINATSNDNLRDT